MGMSRCYSLMKCLLIMFNIIFLISYLRAKGFAHHRKAELTLKSQNNPLEVCVGLGVCAFVSWALWDGRGAEGGAGRAGLCALGLWAGVLALGAVAALAGAARGSASLLAGAFALLALSAVAEAAAAWWGAAHAPQLQRALRDRLRQSLLLEYGALPARTHALDAIQRGLRCCGVDGARDWRRAAWARAPPALDLSVAAPPAHYWVPASCCESSDETECAVARRVPAASAGGPGLHAAPCAPRVLEALRGAARAPLAAGAALLAAHGAALLLALALCLRAQPPRRHKA